jgi:hypothetical protein
VQTVSDRVALKKLKPTSQGRRVLEILVKEYGMAEEGAKKLMQDGGTAFAMTLISKWGL